MDAHVEWAFGKLLQDFVFRFLEYVLAFAVGIQFVELHLISDRELLLRFEFLAWARSFVN